MAKRCPVKSHPDWIALEEKHGTIGAYRLYIQNDYNIPHLDGSERKGKVKITSGTDINGDFYPAQQTIDTLDKNPDVLNSMVDEIVKLFPKIKVILNSISGDSLFKYRNVLNSAIAYANDSYDKKPPMQYASEFLDMFEDSPAVQKILEKYNSKEKIVALMERHEQGHNTSKMFKDFYIEFWKQFRSTFATPTATDILIKSFAQNENLTNPISQGSEIYNYSDIADPMIGDTSSIMGYNEDIEKNTTDNNVMSKETAVKMIGAKLTTSKSDSTIDDKVKAFVQFWDRLKIETDLIARVEGRFTNYAGIGTDRVNDATTILSGENDKIINLTNKFKGEDVTLTAEEQEAFDTIADLVRAYEHKKITKFNIIDDKGKRTKKETVYKLADEETDAALTKTEENLESKNPYIRQLSKWLRKGLKHVTNTRLWAKYISGGENTIVSKMLYKALNNARVPYSNYVRSFEDFFKNEESPTSYLNGSLFNHPNATIEDLETETITLDKDANNGLSEIKLTKAELLSMFLMARQENGKENLLEGVYLDDIQGRVLSKEAKINLTYTQIKNIIAKVEKDDEAMFFVNKVDAAMRDSHTKLNKVFRLLEGYDIPMINKYFPVYHGSGQMTVKKSKNLIEDMRSFKARTGGGAVRLTDPFQVLDNMKLTNAAYVGYAIPVHNGKDMIRNLKKFSHRDDAGFIGYLEGTMDKIQDPSALFSTQGEQETNAWLNKISSNFTIAMLAKNLGVVFKQQISLETAQTMINRTYLRQSGPSVLGMSAINPIKLLKQLSITGFNKGETWMPVEWTQLTENPLFKELIAASPLMADRFQGMINREAGEAIMGKNIGQDKVKIPFLKDKDGKPVTMTKSRLMMGITIMDTLTILRLYNAVILETKDRMNEPKFAALSEEQILAHNVNRLQQIIDGTQPTFDQSNRTGLSRDSNPLIRAITMFSSATSKMSMQLIDSVMAYTNNPTAENGKKLAWRAFHTGVTTSVMLTTINFLWYGLSHGGFDDDDFDDLPTKYAFGVGETLIQPIHGVGTIYGIVASQLDSNPWYKTTQDPVQHIVQEGSEGIANAVKGNYGAASKQIINTIAKAKGLPVTVFNKPYGIAKSYLDN